MTGVLNLKPGQRWKAVDGINHNFDVIVLDGIMMIKWDNFTHPDRVDPLRNFSGSYELQESFMVDEILKKYETS